MPSKRGDGALVFKIVVYGPSMSEKTEVFKLIHGEKDSRSEIIQIPNGKNLLQIFNFTSSRVSNVVFQVVTVTGQQGHHIKPETFLKNTDAIIFIWDSLIDQWNENLESLMELVNFFGEKLVITNTHQPQVDNRPEVEMVVLATKRDLKDIVEISKIREALDAAHLNHILIYETIVYTGVNIERAFVYAIRQAVLNHYKKLSGGPPIQKIKLNSADIPKMEELLPEKQEVPDNFFKEKLDILDKIIFISYSRKDEEIFQIPTVANELRKYFKEVIYYEGHEYDNIIIFMSNNIERCDVFLSFWSQNAAQSEYIKKEWTSADMGHKKIVPVYYDLKDIPFILKRFPCVQFREGELNDNITDIYKNIKKRLGISQKSS